MCIAEHPSNCSNSDEDEYECLYQSLKCSCNYHMDDCDKIMTLGLGDMSHMLIFKDFDKAVTCGKDIVLGRIIDNFSMVTIDSTTAENHESTLCTGTNDLENDTGAHTNLYSDQVEGAFGLFGNSNDTGDITVNFSCSNCDHESCVEDELLSNCDTKESVEDETNSNCDTHLPEDESVRLSGLNSISLDFVNHDHMCQPFCLENYFVT